MPMNETQLRGFIYALELAADDQENYLDSGDAAIDYSADDMRGKAASFKDCAEAAYSIGQTGLGDRFENLQIEAMNIAASMERDRPASVTLAGTPRLMSDATMEDELRRI